MKKIKFLFLLPAAVLCLFSCSNNAKEVSGENDILESKLYSIIPEEYCNIGKSHNKILNDFYFSNTQRSASSTEINYKDLSVEDYCGKIDTVYYIRSIPQEIARNAASTDISAAQFMEDKKLISAESSRYIALAESIIEKPSNSLEETQAAISKIELNALNEKSGSELCEFISYAETAKASLAFWSENIEMLEAGVDKNSKKGRWIFRRLWNKYKHKIAMMAASDAAGSAAGAGAGYAIGGPHGAAIGAAVAGAVSSLQGFRNDSVCVVVPIDKIKKML